MKAIGGCTHAGKPFRPAAKRTPSPLSRIARELAGWAWSLAVMDG